MSERRRVCSDQTLSYPKYIKFKLASGVTQSNINLVCSSGYSLEDFGTIEYSFNQDDWYPVTGTYIALKSTENTQVFFRGSSNTFSFSESKYLQFTTTKECLLSGNTSTLLDYTNPDLDTIPDYSFYKCFYGSKIKSFPTFTASTLGVACYKSMFENCKSVAGIAYLPATDLKESCYESMFKGCQMLTSTTVFVAPTLVTNCYKSMYESCIRLQSIDPSLANCTTASGACAAMFKNCVKLSSGEFLPSGIAANCFESMFEGDIALITPPQLSMTTVADACYKNMFKNCSSITRFSDLLAETLVSECYYGMFEGCLSLKACPKISATTTAPYCQARMFKDCRELRYPTECNAIIFHNGCFNQMYSGCVGMNLSETAQIPCTFIFKFPDDVDYNGLWDDDCGSVSPFLNIFENVNQKIPATINNGQVYYYEPPLMIGQVSSLGEKQISKVSISKTDNFIQEFKQKSVRMGSENTRFLHVPTLYRKLTDYSTSYGVDMIRGFNISFTKIDDTYVPYSCFVTPEGDTLPYINIQPSYITGVPNYMRTTARGYGDGYQLYDWQIYMMIKDIFLINSGKVNFGDNPTVSEYMGLKFLCNRYMLDGAHIQVGSGSSNNVYSYICYDPTKYKSSPSDTSDGYSKLSLSIYPVNYKVIASRMDYKENHPFYNFGCGSFQPTVAGEYKEYLCDMLWTTSNSNCPILQQMSNSSADSRYGLWNLSTYNASWTDSTYSRICFRPQIEHNSYPTFAEATWEEIKSICQSGECTKAWQIGATKLLTTTDNRTYTIRLVDMKPERYAYSDGTKYTHAVFEFVQTIALDDTIRWKLNSVGSNVGGWPQTYFRNNKIALFENLLPSDLKEVLENINILSITSESGSPIRVSSDKLFVPSLGEIANVTQTPYASESPKGKWQYYELHNSAADRVKNDIKSSNYSPYWLRSLTLGALGTFKSVDMSTERVKGVIINTMANDPFGLGASICFAL